MCTPRTCCTGFALPVTGLDRVSLIRAPGAARRFAVCWRSSRPWPCASWCGPSSAGPHRPERHCVASRNRAAIFSYTLQITRSIHRPRPRRGRSRLSATAHIKTARRDVVELHTDGIGVVRRARYGAGIDKANNLYATQPDKSICC